MSKMFKRFLSLALAFAMVLSYVPTNVFATETGEEVHDDCSYDIVVVTEPTCTKPGYTTYTCSCGDSYTEPGEGATGHNFADGVCTVCEITCEHDYVDGTCAICNMAEPVEEEPVEETPVEDEIDEEEEEEEEETECEQHNFAEGICTVCGAEDDSYDVDDADVDGCTCTEPCKFVPGCDCGMCANLKDGCTCAVCAEDPTQCAAMSDACKAGNHAQTFHKIIKNITCVEDGQTGMRCPNCCYSWIVDVPASGQHDFDNGTCRVCEKPDRTKEYQNQFAQGGEIILTETVRITEPLVVEKDLVLTVPYGTFISLQSEKKPHQIAAIEVVKPAILVVKFEGVEGAERQPYIDGISLAEGTKAYISGIGDLNGWKPEGVQGTPFSVKNDGILYTPKGLDDATATKWSVSNAANWKATCSVTGEHDYIEDKCFLCDEEKVPDVVNVAKVGNTEYATIDEAIAAWTNNTTLTLLADVTLTDVIKLSSTEHHILDLGTYTMTAAESKNAIEILSMGFKDRGERGALTINADDTTPGGINAGRKYCIYYKYDSNLTTTYDRPIIYINGGVFAGAGISSTGHSQDQDKCATFNISGGTFNCSLNLSKTKLIISGGTFNSFVNCTGGSTSFRQISGGTFKNWQFMTADAPNKFWVGSGNGNYNVGVYVDSNGYLVVGGPVITKVSPEYPAVSTNYSKWSGYLKYSSAATYGLFYKDVAMAIAKHGEANVTVYEKPAVEAPENIVDTILGESAAPEQKAAVEDVVEQLQTNAAVKGQTPENVPAGAELVVELKDIDIDGNNAPIKVVYEIAPKDENGVEVEEIITPISFRLPIPAKFVANYVTVTHDGQPMGIFAVQGSGEAKFIEIASANFSEFAVEPYSETVVAQIGNVYFETIRAAVNAAQTDETVVILPGVYDGFNISNKSINIKGTVDDDGELLTTIKGGNPAITGHGFNGTISDLKIVDAFKVMYAEPAGNVTVDNVYVTGATYGLHLVAYTDDITWTIQNSYMDLSWANSFGVSDAGDAAIIIKGNSFESTAPYYPDYGALAVNTFLPNVTVEENIFGENTKIYIDKSVDTSEIKISKNYHADGVANAFADDTDGVVVDILEYYKTIDDDGKLTDLVIIPYAAQVGDNKYISLQDALKAITAGATLTLLSDVTIDEKWDSRFTGGKILADNVTIDGNGKTLTFTGDVEDMNYNCVFRFEGDNAKVQNLTIDVSGATKVQRVISAKLSITADNVTIIGNGNRHGIIFGEGAGDALSSVTATITNSTFENMTRGVSDNETGKDAQAVSISGSTFTNAGVNVSASQTVNFTGNTVSGGDVIIITYAKDNVQLKVTATDNTLDDAGKCEVKKCAKVTADEEFVIPKLGSNFNGYTSAGGIWGDTWGNAKESFVIKVLNANGEVMGTASLNNKDDIIDGDVTVTWYLPLDVESDNDEYWVKKWDILPSLDNLPAKVELYVDGERVSGGEVQMNGPDSINKIVAAVAAKDGTITGFYTKLADANAAVQSDGTILILNDSAETVTLAAGITLNGNGKKITNVTAGGDLTFAGHTEIGTFSAGYYNHTITIGEGASVKVTDGRVTVSYGNTFIITGSVADAKTADKSAIKPSLDIVNGLSFTGNGGGVEFNVTNAYVILGDSSTKNSGATGEFNMNFTNSIVDFTNTLKTNKPTAAGLAPEFNLTAKGSIVNFASHLELWMDNTNLTLDNSDMTVGGSFANAGNVNVTNSSDFAVKAPIMSSHGGNTGTISVTGGTFELKDSNEKWVNAGSMSVAKGGKLVVNDFKCDTEGKIVVDATGLAMGDSVTDLLVFSDDTAVTYTDVAVEGIKDAVISADGKIVERELTAVGDVYEINNVADLYLFAKKVNAGNTFAGKTVKLAADIDLANEEWTPIGYMGKTFKGTFDGGNNTIKNLKITKTLSNTSANNGIGLFGRTDSPAVIKNLTIENVDITGCLYVGAVVGYGYTGKAVENVTVKGDIAIDAWWYAGVIGGNGYMNLVNNCHVIGNNGSYIKGNAGSYIGGIWGFRGEGNNKTTNCSVSNVAISGVDRVGGICGIGHYGNTVSGCEIANVTVTATDPDATTVGLIVGACEGTASQPTVITTNKLTDSAAQIDNGDGTFTPVTNLFGTNIDGTVPVTNHEAEINGVLYETLKEAIEKASANDTIKIANNFKLTEKIEISKNITLDLNGKTITTSGIEASRVFVLVNGCTEFVLNGNGGTIRSNDAKAYGIIDVNTAAELTVNGGTYDFDTNDGGLFKFRNYASKITLNDVTVKTNGQVSGPNNDGNELVVNGGTFQSENSYNGINVFSFYVAYAKATFNEVTIDNDYVGAIENYRGEVEINDCDITVVGAHSAPFLSTAVAVEGGGTTTVNGGNYATKPAAASDANGQGSTHGSWTAMIMSSGGNLIINDGTFTNGVFGNGTPSNPRGVLCVGADAYYGDDVAAKLRINGGTFNSVGAAIDCETIWGKDNNSKYTYMPKVGITVMDGNFLGVKGKIIGGCDPISTGNPVNVDIYGGYFAIPVDKEYCGYDMVPSEHSTGVYGVKAEVEAKIGMEAFTTLEEAIKAARNGDTILLHSDVVLTKKLTINKSITIADYGEYTISMLGDAGINITNNADVTFEKFNIDVSDAVIKGDAIIGIGNYSTNGKLTLEEVNVTGNNYSSAYAVFYVYGTSELNIDESNIVLSNDKSSAGGFIKAGDGKNGKVNITETEISLTNAKIGFLDGTVKLEDVNLNIQGGANAINQSALTVIDSTITVKGADGRALTLSQGNVIIKNSTLDFSDCSEGEIRFKQPVNLTTDAVSVIKECRVYADASAVDNAEINGCGINGSEKNMGTVSAANGETIVKNPNWAAYVNGTYYSTVAAAANAAKSGDTIVVYPGKYTEDVTVKSGVTIAGAVDKNGNNLATINGKLNITADGATVKNLNFYNKSGTACYIGAKDVLVEGCDLNGTNGLYQSYTTGKVTFKDSTITGRNTYGVHFDGSKGGEIVIEGCEITGWTSFAGTIEKVTITDTVFMDGNYNLLRFYQNAELNNVTFPSGNAAGYNTNGMRIDTGDRGAGMEGIILKFNDCKTNDGTDLEGAFPDKVIIASDIYVDDVLLQRVAKIGNAYYATLDEAVKDAESGATIELIESTAGVGVVIDKDITIDFGGYTYTFTEGVGSTGTPSNGFQILQNNTVTLKNNTVTLKNGTLKVADEAADKFYILVQNYANLTVDSMTLDGTNLDKWSRTDGDSYVLSNNSGKVKIIGNTNITANDEGDKAFAFDVCKYESYESPVVNVNTTGTISGKIEVSEEISNNLNISGGIFTVEIAEAWCADGHIPAKNENGTYGVKRGKYVARNTTTGQGYETLKDAIDAAKTGDTIALLVDDIKEDVTVVQAPDVAITIDGEGMTFKGTITVDGKSAAYATAGLTIQNVVFDATAITKDASINLGVSGNTNTRYTSNVKVYQCSFSDNDKSAAAIKSYTGGDKNLTITACTATGMHSLAQLKNVAGIKVEECKITESKNGVSLGASSGAIINNCEVDVDGYGIRADGNGAYDTTVKNVTITAHDPIVVRYNTADGYKLNVDGSNTLTGTNDAEYQVIFTKEDDGSYVNPDVAAAITVDDDFSVFPIYKAKIGDLYYVTIDNALTAANAGDVVTIFAGTFDRGLSVNKAITVVGETDADGNNLVTFNGKNGKLNITADGATVKNLNFYNKSGTACYIGAKDVLVEGCDLNGTNGLYQSYTNGLVTFKDSTITGRNTYGVHFDGSKGGKIVIDNCKITGWTSFAGSIENVTISNTTFEEGNYNQLRFYQNAELNKVTFNPEMTVDFGKNNVQADFNNCSVDGADDLTDIIYLGDIAEMGVNVNIDKKPVVVVAKAKYGSEPTTYHLSLPEAVNSAKSGATVTVLVDAAGTGVVIDKDITIDFNDKTYTFTAGVGSTGTMSNGFQILKGNTVTLKNGTLKVADEAADKFYILVQNYANLTVEDMTLDGTNLDKWSKRDGDSYVLSNNSGNVNITGDTTIIANNDGDKAFAFDVCKYESYEPPVVNVNTTGKITGKIEVSKAISTNLNISGGTFTEKLAEDWCAKDYIPVENEDGTYTVKIGFFVVHNDNTGKGYETLKQAIEEANEGNSLTLEERAAGSIAIVGKELTINKNGVEIIVAALKGFTVLETDEKHIVIPAASVNEKYGAAYAYIENETPGHDSEPLMYLQVALDTATAGQTVRLTQSLEGENAPGTIIIPANVVLDIQSFTLEADYVIGLNGSKLTAEVSTTLDDNTPVIKGALKVAADNLTLGEDPYVDTAANENNAAIYIIPVWDPDEECYVFTRARANHKTFTIENDTLVYTFGHTVDRYVGRLLWNDGSSDNKVDVVIRMSWTLDGNVAYQDFVYADKHVSAATQPNVVYTITMRGLSTLGVDPAEINITPMFITDCGAIAAGTTYYGNSLN